MKDNKGFVELEGRLTSLGKMRVLENNFDITKFAVSDDGTNYRLINENLLDPYIAIERSLLFNKNNDSNMLLKNRIPIDKLDDMSSSIFDFNVGNRTIGDNIKINPINFFNKIEFPHITKSIDDVNKYRFFITDAELANKEFKMELTIDHENIPLMIQSAPSPISITLHNSKYFDIRLKEEERAPTLTDKLPEDINWESAFEDSRNDQYSKPIRYPKTITMMNGRDRPNGFILKYRGNFKYEGKSRSEFNSHDDYINNTKVYNTILTIRCELTGLYEDILLQLIKTESKEES